MTKPINARAQSGEAALEERLLGFIGDPHRILPEKPLAAYLGRVKATVTAAQYDAYLARLKETKYREIYEVLFAPERSLGMQYSATTRRLALGFYRGKADLASYAAKGMSPLEVTTRYARRRATLDAILPPDIIAEPVTAICEVGGAWGSTMKYLIDRFRPEKYFNFEIDGGYAEWTARTFGSITMPTDGETLAGIDDSSIDIVACEDVLPWVPPLKAFSYFSEFARVVRPGGIIFFNVLIAERVTKERAAVLLTEGFPRRGYAHVPQSFIAVNFPIDSFDILHEAPILDNGTDKMSFVIRRN
jgi:SAM-dependent methyltransferase